MKNEFIDWWMKNEFIDWWMNINIYIFCKFFIGSSVDVYNFVEPNKVEEILIDKVLNTFVAMNQVTLRHNSSCNNMEYSVLILLLSQFTGASTIRLFRQYTTLVFNTILYTTVDSNMRAKL